VDTLEALGPLLPPQLIDPAASRGLATIAASVPDVATTFGFECRLRETDPTVDLGLAISPANGGRELLASLDGNLEEPIGPTRDARWRRIRDFGRGWSDPDAALHDWVPFVFMEFDAAAAAATIPIPSLFVALDAPLAPLARDAPPAVSPPIAALRQSFALLSGRPLEPDVDEAVVRAFRSLPEGGWVMHVGVMLGRDSKGLRLSVCAPGDAVPAYLRGLDGDEAAAGAAELLERIRAHVPRTQVDFDLTPALHPRLGFGLQPRVEGGWARLLADVEAEGWSSSRKTKALLEWPGRSEARLGGVPHVLHRNLSHVKLVCTSGEPTQAKAYIGVTPYRLAAGNAAHAGVP
jgi:hypothetical protein